MYFCDHYTYIQKYFQTRWIQLEPNLESWESSLHKWFYFYGCLIGLDNLVGNKGIQITCIYLSFTVPKSSCGSSKLSIEFFLATSAFFFSARRFCLWRLAAIISENVITFGSSWLCSSASIWRMTNPTVTIQSTYVFNHNMYNKMYLKSYSQKFFMKMYTLHVIHNKISVLKMIILRAKL